MRIEHNHIRKRPDMVKSSSVEYPQVIEGMVGSANDLCIRQWQSSILDELIQGDFGVWFRSIPSYDLFKGRPDMVLVLEAKSLGFQGLSSQRLSSCGLLTC